MLVVLTASDSTAFGREQTVSNPARLPRWTHFGPSLDVGAHKLRVGHIVPEAEENIMSHLCTLQVNLINIETVHISRRKVKRPNLPVGFEVDQRDYCCAVNCLTWRHQTLHQNGVTHWQSASPPCHG